MVKTKAPALTADILTPKGHAGPSTAAAPATPAVNLAKGAAYTKTLTFRMDEERYAQLRELAYRTGAKHQDIFIEMFDALIGTKLKDGTLK